MRLGAEEALDALGDAPEQREADGEEHEHPPDVLVDRVEPEEPVGKEEMVRERREHAVHEKLDRPRGEHAETPEDRGVHRACDRVAEDLLLENPDAEQVREPRADVAEPGVVEPAEPKFGDEPPRVPGEEAERGNDYEREDEIRGSQAGVSALWLNEKGPEDPDAADTASLTTLGVLDGLSEYRKDLQHITNNPVVGDLEYGGLAVLVDGDDGLGGAHPGEMLNGA